MEYNKIKQINNNNNNRERWNNKYKLFIKKDTQNNYIPQSGLLDMVYS